jgi:hypothetical protein
MWCSEGYWELSSVRVGAGYVGFTWYRAIFVRIFEVGGCKPHAISRYQLQICRQKYSLFLGNNITSE